MIKERMNLFYQQKKHIIYKMIIFYQLKLILLIYE